MKAIVSMFIIAVKTVSRFFARIHGAASFHNRPSALQELSKRPIMPLPATRLLQYNQ
jgi:hypothetical protein